MFDLMQFKAGSPAEVGVQSQYLDGELHFVDNALTKRLVGHPEFEIFWLVVISIAVFVMYLLVAAQRAAKHLFHYKAVLVGFFSAAKVYAPVAGINQVALVRYWTPFSASVATLFRAEFLVVIVARWTAIFVAKLTAFDRLRAILALQQHRWSLAHIGQCSLSGALVKENF
jgi:hypothetical protein